MLATSSSDDEDYDSSKKPAMPPQLKSQHPATHASFLSAQQQRVGGQTGGAAQPAMYQQSPNMGQNRHNNNMYNNSNASNNNMNNINNKFSLKF